ncbi:MAG: SPFH domain-containing protein [Motiliproteus sp.]
MTVAILSILAMIIGLSGFLLTRLIPSRFPALIQRIIKSALIIFGVLGIVSRSFVIVDADAVGHLKRVYLADDLPPGKIIAQAGEKGPQANILGPGFHFIWFVRVLYDVEMGNIVEIPEGTYGFISTKDGAPLRQGQYIADPWSDDKIREMQDGSFFLGAGGGQKGPQLTVLPPGKYRLNQYLYSVTPYKALDVPTGNVAVIRANVSTIENCPSPHSTAGGSANKNLSAPIVPKGCMGVWDEALPPGRYYLNQKAFVPTVIPTRVQVWTYRGGYTQRKVDLSLSEDGTIKQTFTETMIKYDPKHADRAINVRVEGWTFPVDIRVLVQVHPAQAPRVVASVGTLKEVEDNIITPTIRDALRTIGGHPDRKVMDFVEKRDEIMQQLEAVLVPEGEKAGVTIQEAKMGEPALPPELMVARLRKQLATQLKATYEEERKAQTERINVTREKATADQQPTLVTAEIEKKAAEHRKTQLELEGEGEKLRLMQIAQGQKAQVDVLGQDRVLQLQMLKATLEVAAENPDIIKVPMVMVGGTGTSSLEGAAAVLGASNFTRMLDGISAKPKAMPK